MMVAMAYNGGTPTRKGPTMTTNKYLTIGEFAINPQSVVAVGPPFSADLGSKSVVLHMHGGFAFEVEGDQAEVVAALEAASQPQPEMGDFIKINKAIARRMQLGQAPIEAQEQVLATLSATTPADRTTDQP